MYSHALYTGTAPRVTSTGSLFSVIARTSSIGLTGEADPPRAGTIPFVSSPGSLATAETVASGAHPDGQGLSFPCGPYHAGEEVA